MFTVSGKTKRRHRRKKGEEHEPSKDVVLYVEGPRADIACVYVSGRRLNRSAGMMRGHHFRINLMPWIHWDE